MKNANKVIVEYVIPDEVLLEQAGGSMVELTEELQAFVAQARALGMLNASYKIERIFFEDTPAEKQ